MKQRKNQEGKTKRKPDRRTTKAKQKTNQEIREEMLKKLENSKLK